jgi:hypothetical protein
VYALSGKVVIGACAYPVSVGSLVRPAGNIWTASAVWADSCWKRKKMSLVEFGFLNANWRKSRRSVHNGACIEVTSTPGVIAVRDSVDRSGPRVLYTAQAWQSFIEEAKMGDVRILH